MDKTQPHFVTKNNINRKNAKLPAIYKRLAYLHE